MKKINVLIVLGLFVLLIGAVQPAHAAMLGSWVPTLSSVRGSSAASPENDFLIKDLAQLNAAGSKFEGLLDAYSINQNRTHGGVKGEVEVGAIAYDSARRLSHALEQFNLALIEVYPTLSEEEQLAVREAYSSLELYLEDLAVETNVIFGREVFRPDIQNREPFGRFVSVEVFPESPAID